jgi:hypothetical protein
MEVHVVNGNLWILSLLPKRKSQFPALIFESVLIIGAQIINHVVSLYTMVLWSHAELHVHYQLTG